MLKFCAFFLVTLSFFACAEKRIKNNPVGNYIAVHSSSPSDLVMISVTAGHDLVEGEYLILGRKGIEKYSIIRTERILDDMVACLLIELNHTIQVGDFAYPKDKQITQQDNTGIRTP